MICSPMKEEHIQAVAKLEQQLFSDSWSEENLRESLAQEHAICFVAEGDNVLGYVLCYQSFEEGEILRIAVAEEGQRQGIGQGLFETLIEECGKRNISHILLDVREGNEKARKFYEKQGFVVDGKRPRFYRNPEEDAVLMSYKV